MSGNGRTAAVRPEPPAWLDPESAATWREIVAAYPARRFLPGGFDHEALWLYCSTTTGQRDAAARMAATRDTPDCAKHEKRLVRLTALAITLATKLRFFPQQRIDRRAAILRRPFPGD